MQKLKLKKPKLKNRKKLKSAEKRKTQHRHEQRRETERERERIWQTGGSVTKAANLKICTGNQGAWRGAVRGYNRWYLINYAK